MRFLRGLLGAVLWILGMVLGLLGLVLCVTLILLPLGIPLLRAARRLIDKAILLMLPRPIANPAASLRRGAKRAKRKAEDAVPEPDLSTRRLRKRGRKALKQSKKRVGG